MPIYRLTVEKYLSAQAIYWTNVYHANLEAGVPTSVASDLVAAERPLYNSEVIITKVSHDLVEVDSNYSEPLIVNLAGTRSVTGDRMPLFVTARVDLRYEGSRPGRKYLRGVIYENDTTFTQIGSGLVTLLNTYLTALLAIPSLCDEDGDDLTGGAVFLAPAMRQLRRGSKKKTTP
jgi:hypothetical protein